jgi:hypothetical protein
VSIREQRRQERLGDARLAIHFTAETARRALKERDRAIRAGAKLGLSPAEMARIAGVSVRVVRRALALRRLNAVGVR